MVSFIQFSCVFNNFSVITSLFYVLLLSFGLFWVRNLFWVFWVRSLFYVLSFSLFWRFKTADCPLSILVTCGPRALMWNVFIIIFDPQFLLALPLCSKRSLVLSLLWFYFYFLFSFQIDRPVCVGGGVYYYWFLVLWHCNQCMFFI